VSKALEEVPENPSSKSPKKLSKNLAKYHTQNPTQN
jgi:hypothetical protein